MALSLLKSESRSKEPGVPGCSWCAISLASFSIACSRSILFPFVRAFAERGSGFSLLLLSRCLACATACDSLSRCTRAVGFSFSTEERKREREREREREKKKWKKKKGRLRLEKRKTQKNTKKHKKLSSPSLFSSLSPSPSLSPSLFPPPPSTPPLPRASAPAALASPPERPARLPR